MATWSSTRKTVALSPIWPTKVEFALGPGGDIIVDGHLPPPTEAATHHNVERLTDRSTIDQALGYLIGQGYPPDQAQVELAHRATTAGVSLPQIAQQILLTAHRPDPNTQQKGQGHGLGRPFSC